jgi:hypothetical protein
MQQSQKSKAVEHQLSHPHGPLRINYLRCHNHALYVAWITLCRSSSVDIKQKPIAHFVVYVNEAVPGSQNGLQAELSAQYKDAADLEEILYPLCSQEAVRLLNLSNAIEKNGKVMVIVKAFDFHLPAYDILCPSVLNGDWEVTAFIEAPESRVGWVCSS